MQTFRESNNAVSSVIGVILMVGLTVVLVATMAGSVFDFAIAPDAPDANLVIRHARGNITNFTGNEIVIAHKGGEILRSDSIKIIVNGEGKEALRSEEISGGIVSIGVTYANLEGYNYVNDSGTRKDEYFLGSTNIEYSRIASNDTWNPGEVVILYGADGINDSNTNNVNKKYKLNPGSKVTVAIVDVASNKIIANSFYTIKNGDGVLGH